MEHPTPLPVSSVRDLPQHRSLARVAVRLRGCAVARQRSLGRRCPRKDARLDSLVFECRHFLEFGGAIERRTAPELLRLLVRKTKITIEQAILEPGCRLTSATMLERSAGLKICCLG